MATDRGWQSLETAWLRRLEILAKIGVLDQFIEAERADRTPFHLLPQFTLAFARSLYSCIVKQSFEPDALRDIITSLLLDTSYDNTDPIVIYNRIKLHVKERRVYFLARYKEGYTDGE